MSVTSASHAPSRPTPPRGSADGHGLLSSRRQPGSWASWSARQGPSRHMRRWAVQTGTVPCRPAASLGPGRHGRHVRGRAGRPAAGRCRWARRPVSLLPVSVRANGAWSVRPGPASPAAPAAMARRVETGAAWTGRRQAGDGCPQPPGRPPAAPWHRGPGDGAHRQDDDHRPVYPPPRPPPEVVLPAPIGRLWCRDGSR